MKTFFAYLLIIIFAANCQKVNAQSLSLQGQASLWLSGKPEKSLISSAGIRYIPDLFLEKSLSGNLLLDAELSVNSYLTGNISKWEMVNTQSDVKPYRLWLRMSGDQFEARVGLQKINFGSAVLFRPLMWFDRLDPRDPLRITDGVYGLLLRYYFQNNANLWIWGLSKNDNVKGWETKPSKKNSFEFGGRLQMPLFTGESAVSFHSRLIENYNVDQEFSLSKAKVVRENRFAFDGKWDVGIGLWMEGTIQWRDKATSETIYQKMYTVGADYTFDIGNGLNILTEYFSLEYSDVLFNSGRGIDFSGLLADYPIGLLDKISAIYYRDWYNKENYFTFNWQRVYDDWIIYVIGFVNPETVRLNKSQSGTNLFAGNGFQLMIVFNH